MSVSHEVKVTVCVVTYNQEKYIRECLESVLNQEADFNYEVIVGDDGSDDNTRSIICELLEKYPRKLKAVFHDKNVGPTKNYFSVHNLARGEYVAHLDGDDYALPNKLKALVSHLDKHEDCAIVWHRIKILDENGRFALGMPLTPVIETYGKSKLYISDLALYYGLTGVHSGSMYRASEKVYSETDGEALDYYMTLSFLLSGKCAMYINEPYGVYRFIKSDNTITRAKGNSIVGKAKLSLFNHYVKVRPDLAGPFAAQCVFEVFLRLYLRYPLVSEYIKAIYLMRAFPNPLSVFKIFKVFLQNRNSVLMKRLSD